MLSNGESSIVFSWKKNRLITFGFFPRSKQKGAILSHLFVAFLIWLIGGFPSIVFALPQDGQIVEGAGSITTPTATSMQVDQNTSQMIINWQSFSTGASESVNFSQPSSSSIVLNRVIGTDPSLLLGNLTANGQVFISNGSGVFFGPGSQVDTHGLIATTMQISDQDFLDQNYNFIQDVDNPLTSVINEGTISATSYVGLLAPAVENKGTIITASLGSVDLAAGKAATLDFTGDGLIQFEVTEAVTGTVTDKDGNVLEDRVSNSGLIQADGGQVRMTAKDAGDVIRHVVNMEGTIQANTVVEKDGRVFLMGGDSGIVNVSGTISAKGDDAGEKGGTVHVLGEKVGLFDNAKVDVSGDAGGGEALIGGDYQGANENIQNSTANFIDEGASIYADALTTGDGGKIIVWADDTTRVYGTLSASAVTDDGGFIETSGKNYLDINVVPDVSSVYGIGGEWLIDPNNIEIIAGSGNTNINASSPFASTDDTAQLGVNLIITALGSGDVTITTASLGNNGQSGDITLSTALDYNGTGTNTLTLTASNDIIINNTISDSVGGGDVLNLVFDASGVIDINANIDTSGGTLTATANAGAIELGTTVTISTGTLNANSITVTANTIDLNSTTSVGTLSVSGNGTILQGTGNITVTSAMTWTGGTIGGSGLLTTNGGVTTTMATVFPVVLSRDWDNNGTINWDPTNSNDLTISSTFTLHNKSGANFNLDNSANSGAAILGGGIITNTGTTTLNSTLTPTLINPQFDNVGTVTVTQGDLQLAGDGTDTGSYTVASSQTLTFSGGTRVIDGDISGSGTVNFSGGTLSTTSSNLSITAADVNFSVAFAAGSGTVNIIRSGGGSIGLGAASGDMTITDADLDFISAANVKIGDGTVGTITVNGISNIGISDTLTLTSGAGIVFDTGASSVNNNLAVVAGGDITQTAGLTVNGTSSFTVTGSNVITLTDTANDFTGDITLSSGSGTVEVDDIDDMSIAASTLGGTVTLKANNGLTINGNLTSNGSNAIASISLDGDANNSSDGTDNLVIAAGVTIEITGHISGFITVDATNGGITGNGALTMNAINGITINDDYSGSGTLTLNSDSTSDGIGDLTLANNVDITTGGNDIEITQADTSFGTGVTVNVVAAAVTSNFTKDVTVDGTDAAGVTAGSLTTTSTGDIIVDGVTSGELTNIAGTYSLSAGGDVTFQTTATDTNNDLTVNANNDINVKVDVTSGGKFTAKADNDSSGAGDFILDTGVTVTASAGDIDVTGFNITENGTLTASGSITRTETKPVTSTSTTTEEEEEDIDQGTNSSFLTDFTEPATSGC